jgi:uncharacterized protein
MVMVAAMNDTVGIAVFAKAPLAGVAKTRLIPCLGPKGAADLQRRMIERTVEIALHSRLGLVSLWCTPNCENELFSRLRENDAIELHAQTGSDLGARMLNAFDLLTPGYPLIVIGTDCPVLESRLLNDCASLLRRGYDAVFLPAEDGGYALVGAAKPWPDLFRDIPWGTNLVMQETRQRALQLGLQISEPLVVWDIDTPEDYQRAVGQGLIEATGCGDESVL